MEGCLLIGGDIIKNETQVSMRMPFKAVQPLFFLARHPPGLHRACVELTWIETQPTSDPAGPMEL